MRKLLAIASLLFISAVPVASYGWNGAAAAATLADAWGIDSAHTEVNFSVTHFFTPVTGTFDDFEVTLEIDPENITASSVEARIAVASVNTGNEKRDGHLRTADFFDAKKYPYITFKSTSIRKVSDDEFVASGVLTIRNQKRQVELPIRWLGTQPIPEEMRGMLGGAKEIASFKASMTIDRNEYGVGSGSWAATMVVGGDVTIDILLEAHRR